MSPFPRPTTEPRAAPGAWRLALVLAALAGVLCGLAAAAPELARAALEARLARLEARTGRRVTVGRVAAAPWGALALEDLAVSEVDGVTPQLSVARVETDLSVLALALGRRRPTSVRIRGLRARLAVGPRGLAGPEGLADLLPRGGGEPPGTARGRPLSVTLDDAHLDLRLRVPGLQGSGVEPNPAPGSRAEAQEAPLGQGRKRLGAGVEAQGGGRPRVVVHLAHARLVRGAGWEGQAHGRVEVAGASVDVDARLDGEGRASVSLAPALAVPLEVGGRRVVLGLAGVERDRRGGPVSLVGPRIALREGELEAEAVVLAADTAPTDGGPGAGAPGMRTLLGLSSVRVEDLRGALRSGGEVVEGAAEEVRLSRGEVGAGPRLVARDVRLGASRWSATLSRATASLRGAPWAAAVPLSPGPPSHAAGSPAEPPSSPSELLQAALRSVVLEGPKITLQAPSTARATPPARPRAGLAVDPGLTAAPGGDGPGPRWGDLVRETLRSAKALASQVDLAVRDGAVQVDGGPGGQPYGVRGIQARLSPSPSGATAVSVTATVARAGRPTGEVDLRATLDETGRVERASGRVRGTDLAHLMSRASDYILVDRDTALDLDFSYTASPVSEGAGAGRRAQGHEPPNVRRLRGTVRATDLGFQAWRISHEPVRGVSLKARFDATVEDAAGVPGGRVVSVQVPSLELGEARVEGAARLVLGPDARPRVSVRVRMPRQDCAAVRRAIPASLIPRLRGLEVRGDMEFLATLDVDLAHPKELTLRVEGDLDRCQIVQLGGRIDLDALRGRRYVHHPVEPERGRRDDIAVGPGTSQWVRSKVLPTFVKAAAIVTEDRAFTRHGGVRWDLVARALKLDLAGERFIYGGSTITQQLVKNLYLTREKTLARKLEEAIIALEMERRLSKDQILTLYINVVEYGPDIYGVKRAARFYFGKQPWELSPLEAAFIMGLKPFPKAGFKQWTKQRLNGWWVTRVKKVLEMMYRREHAITWAELQAAAPYQPHFRPPGAPMSGAPAYVPPAPAPPDAVKR